MVLHPYKYITISYLNKYITISYLNKYITISYLNNYITISYLNKYITISYLNQYITAHHKKNSCSVACFISAITRAMFCSQGAQCLPESLESD